MQVGGWKLAKLRWQVNLAKSGQNIIRFIPNLAALRDQYLLVALARGYMYYTTDQIPKIWRMETTAGIKPAGSD